MNLTGFQVAVTATSRAEQQVALLHRRGATVHWTPVLAETQPAAPAELLAATEKLLAEPAAAYAFTTGRGVRIWLNLVTAAGKLAEVQALLNRSYILARGPKTKAALAQFQIKTDFVAGSETWAELHPRLTSFAGQNIWVQEHGQPMDAEIFDLITAGVGVAVLSPYRVPVSGNTTGLNRLLKLILSGDLAAITFTSAPAVQAVIGAAKSQQNWAVLAPKLQQILLVSVGPVTTAALAEFGFSAVEPTQARLTPMIGVLAENLIEKSVPVPPSLVQALTSSEQLIYQELQAAGGRVVTRKQLLEKMPGVSDQTLNVIISRLRKKVGAHRIHTVRQRGYWLS